VCNNSGAKQFTIQKPKKGETVDQYFDAKVADPSLVRDDRSAETAAGLRLKTSDLWLFNQIPFHDA
jgi:prolyl oligopeptidase